MAKEQETKVVTRAEKKDATKKVIKELLAEKPLKHNELIEETARLYAERFGGEDTENINDVKGRVGSVLDIMKKESDVAYEGGMYALKARSLHETEEKPKKTKAKNQEKPTGEEKEKTVKKTVKKAKVEPVESPAEQAEPNKEQEKPKKTRAKKEKIAPLPVPPLQPIAPTAPVTPEVAPEPIPEDKEQEKPKKTTRARAKKTAQKEEKGSVPQTELPAQTADAIQEKGKEKPVETPQPVLVEQTEQPEPTPAPVQIKNPPVVQPKGEIAKKSEVMDMSFLFGGVQLAKDKAKREEKPQPKQTEKPVEGEKKTEKEAESVAEKQPQETAKPATKETPLMKVVKTEEKRARKVVQAVRKSEKKPLTAEERLRESFLKRLLSLGGDYFEYYSVYLLERYSMKNGRRLESLRICGGDHDGGIDGEIELTDKFGFRETIYIQAKNWNPDKGDERLWVVGETLLQQFIGACACRQAQDRKQHCRGIFITTSRFTPDAKRILQSMSDKIVGYDGEDLFEAAKECQFGLLYENGNWKLDEKLLSSEKAFFHML